MRRANFPHDPDERLDLLDALCVDLERPLATGQVVLIVLAWT